MNIYYNKTFFNQSIMKTKIIKLFDPKTNSSELRNIKSVINSHQWASGAGSHFFILF